MTCKRTTFEERTLDSYKSWWPNTLLWKPHIVISHTLWFNNLNDFEKNKDSLERLVGTTEKPFSDKSWREKLREYSYGISEARVGELIMNDSTPSGIILLDENENEHRYSFKHIKKAFRSHPTVTKIAMGADYGRLAVNTMRNIGMLKSGDPIYFQAFKMIPEIWQLGIRGNQ